MVFISSEGYPKTGALLNSILPFYDVLFPRIFRLFVEFCKDEKRARQALTLGYFPEIEVVPVRDHPTAGGIYRGAHGGRRDRVYLNNLEPGGRVEPYEQEPDTIRARSVEMATLHEMVHWARHVGGNAEGPCEEAGVDFENAVFGVKTSRGGCWS